MSVKTGKVYSWLLRGFPTLVDLVLVQVMKGQGLKLLVHEDQVGGADEKEELALGVY